MRALPDDRPLAIAHRGGNTLDKLEAAVAAGVDYLETDLWFRRGRLEIRHDRTSGPLPFLYDRWSLRPNVWRQLVLEPVLEAAKDRCRLFLDLKGDAPELADALADAVRRSGMADAVAFCGYWPHLDRLRELVPQAPLFYTTGSLRLVERLRPRMKRGEIGGVSIDSRFLTQEIVGDLKATGVSQIFTWAVETEEVAQRVIDWGVTGVISDSLELLVSIRDGDLP